MKINFITPNISYQKAVFKNNRAAQNPVTFKGEDPCGENYDESTDDIKGAYLKQLDEWLKEQNKQSDYYFSGKQYQDKLETHPSVAFIYNSNLTKRDKLQLLSKSETLFSQAEIAKRTGLHYKKFDAWAENGNLDFDLNPYFSRSMRIIDIETPKNKAFFEYIESILPHSIPGENLIRDYDFRQDEFARLVKQGKLRPVGFDDIPETDCGPYNLLFDMEDEVNQETVKRHLRTTPLPSEKYGEGKKRFVPVHYLQRLGYGDALTLYKMVKNGELAGKIEQVDNGKVRVYTDIGAKGAQVKLSRLRYQNPDIISLENFRQELGLGKQYIENALEDGEIEIIGEYIFKDDYKNRLIDKKNPKNLAFADRIFFERQLAEEQRAKQRENVRKARIQRIKNPIESLRMALVWSMCPYTKMMASKAAKEDGYVSSIIAKIAEEGMEKLSHSEDIKYKAYCKNFWTMAGIEEYREAHAKAKIIIDQFKKGGIEAVEDPEARKIIKDFLEEYKGVQ